MCDVSGGTAGLWFRTGSSSDHHVTSIVRAANGCCQCQPLLQHTNSGYSGNLRIPPVQRGMFPLRHDGSSSLRRSPPLHRSPPPCTTMPRTIWGRFSANTPRFLAPAASRMTSSAQNEGTQYWRPENPAPAVTPKHTKRYVGAVHGRNPAVTHRRHRFRARPN